MLQSLCFCRLLLSFNNHALSISPVSKTVKRGRREKADLTMEEKSNLCSFAGGLIVLSIVHPVRQCQIN